MPDLKTIEGKILVDADRYEELIKLESRVEIIVNYLKIDQYISVEKILTLLGFHTPKRKEKSYEEICEVDADL